MFKHIVIMTLACAGLIGLSFTAIGQTILFDGGETGVALGTTDFSFMGTNWTGGEVATLGDSTLYGSGARSYHIDPGPVVITFDDPVESVTFFYIHGGGFGAGTATASLDSVDVDSADSIAATFLADPLNFVKLSSEGGIDRIDVTSGVIDNFEFAELPAPPPPGEVSIVETWLFPLDSSQSTTGSVDASTGVGLATLFSDDSFTLVVDHDVASPTDAHIHGPAARGVAAGVVMGLNFAENPIVLEADLAADQVDDLMDGLWYVNIHTAADPGGAIRGQLDEPGSIARSYFFHLSSDQSTTGSEDPSTGIGQASLTQAGEFTFAVEHGVADPTDAHIHGPAGEGVAAGVVFGLNAAQNPITLSTSLGPQQIQHLLDGLYYVNIHTAENPGGAIRAQIVNGGAGLPVGGIAALLVLSVSLGVAGMRRVKRMRK